MLRNIQQRKVGTPIRSVLLALAFLTMAGASQAALYTIDGSDPNRFFTLTSPSNGTLIGELHQVDLNAVFLPDLDVTAGTVSDFSAQDWLVLEVIIDNSSTAALDELGFAVLGFPFPAVNYQGSGTLTGPGQAPLNVIADLANFGARFDFDTGNVSSDNVEPGETSVRLFAAYAGGALAPGQNANFMLSSGAGDQDFSVGIVVPEPSTAILAMIGLAGLGMGARRRRA